MKKKILLSPLLIIVLIIIVGVGVAGAAVFLGGGGNTENVNLSKGLIGWWKFDGDAKDATPNANNGTVNGAALTADRKGQTNKAYSFNGTTSDYVSIANASPLNISGAAISFGAWIKLSGGAGLNRFFISKSAGDWNAYHISVSDANKFRPHLQSGGGLTYWDSTLTPALDTWYFVMVTYNGSKVILYINGIEDSNRDASGGIGTNTGTLRFSTGRLANEFPWPGLIDDVRIYNRALSATEVTALYESYNPGIVMSDLQKGLISQWKMDGDAKDATPNANNGTVSGVTLIADRKGQTNKAYNFDGSSYISINDSNSLRPASALTISAWINTNTASGDTAIFSKGFSDTRQSYHLTKYNDQILFMTVGANGLTNYEAYSAHVITTGTWFHVVAVFNGATNSIYINGAVSGTPLTNTDTIPYSSRVVRIGSAFYDGGSGPGWNYYFNGKIDDVRLYNRALSQTEITALYESYDPGIVVSTLQKGLVGQWKMDGDAKDETPYGDNGTVSSATLTTDRKGQVNKAYNFAGTSSIAFPVTSPLNLSASNSFSIAIWANAASVAAGGTGRPVITFRPSTLRGIGIQEDSSGAYSFLMRDETGAVGVTTSGSSVGVWTHLVGTYDQPTNTMTFYKNGILVNTTTGKAAATTISNAFGGDNPISGNSEFFLGILDDARVYNRVLSQTEVTELYESY